MEINIHRILWNLMILNSAKEEIMDGKGTSCLQ